MPALRATEHDRASRDRHDTWHRDDDAYHEEWGEEVEALMARVVKLEGQVGLTTELLGRSLDRILRESEPA